MKVWLRRASRLPREVTPVLALTNAAKEIGAPTLAFLRLVNPVVPGNTRRYRDAIFLDARGGCHPGMKLPI